MKLSFSTKGWHRSSFDEFCGMANDLGFEGIELHNIHNRLFTDPDGAFHDYAAAATRRRLYERGLCLPWDDVRPEAIAWTVSHNGCSPRVARQFVDHLGARAASGASQ